jgi:uncharacterized membrane protein
VAHRPRVRAALATPPAPATTVRRVPNWLIVSTLIICILGVLDASYLTYEHFSGSTTLACSDTGAVNCLKVTTSSYSKLLGVPVALAGLVYFVAMTVMCLSPMWRSSSIMLRTIRFAGALIGMISVLYLVWVELFRVDAICLWCTGVHVLTFALFALVLTEYVDAVGAD